jgi:hypothetical protein
MARARARRKDQQDWTSINPHMPDVCPLCANTPAFPNDMLAHLQSHAPTALCQRCDGKEKGWRLDTDGVRHFRPDVSLFYCSNCGRYTPTTIREEVS